MPCYYVDWVKHKNIKVLLTKTYVFVRHLTTCQQGCCLSPLIYTNLPSGVFLVLGSRMMALFDIILSCRMIILVVYYMPALHRSSQLPSGLGYAQKVGKPGKPATCVPIGEAPASGTGVRAEKLQWPSDRASTDRSGRYIAHHYPSVTLTRGMSVENP